MTTGAGITAANDLERQGRDLGAAVGVIVALLVAAGLVGLRGVLDNTSVALVLVLVIVTAAAIGGRKAGIATAVMAGIAFDFFHTEPYGRLTIDSAQDVETLVLLVAVGLAAGEIVVHSHRVQRRNLHSHDELERLRRVAEAVNAHPEQTVATVEHELADCLSLDRCWYESGPSTEERPEIGPRGSIDQERHRLSGGGLELPARPVALPVRAGTRELGRFVLVPTAGVGVALDKRMAAACMADIAGVALAGRTTL